MVLKVPNLALKSRVGTEVPKCTQPVDFILSRMPNPKTVNTTKKREDSSRTYDGHCSRGGAQTSSGRWLTISTSAVKCDSARRSCAVARRVGSDGRHLHLLEAVQRSGVRRTWRRCSTFQGLAQEPHSLYFQEEEFFTLSDPILVVATQHVEM